LRIGFAFKYFARHLVFALKLNSHSLTYDQVF
jgi:hypothetical protein